jgi:phospholipase C
MRPTTDVGEVFDGFDYVVVLMLENRSFDNLLGYLYPDGVPDNAPAGKTFEGVAGKNLANPIPDTATGQSAPPRGVTSIPVSPVPDPPDYHQPFPDPGEQYYHVNTQLFNVIDGNDKAPYNLPSSVPTTPGMQGFVSDYIASFPLDDTDGGAGPKYQQYQPIMQCFKPEQVPVLTTLAEQFAVFDHWFCSVPSHTCCNRAFWHAGTSWGHVINFGDPDYYDENTASWVADSIGETLFNKISDSGLSSPLDWRVYSSNEASLTGIIHAGALAAYHTPLDEHFPRLEDFFTDCAAGTLPKYSFLEPVFWTPHNDQHPSTWNDEHYGPDVVGSVLLGEELIWSVYNAIKNSTGAHGGKGNSWRNTLLIITHDEHGGCYDHVAPPTGVTPPDLSGYTKWDDFDFTRLGVRVPMVMVSAHIAPNTVINTCHDHTSFLRTMFEKWSRYITGPLTARDAAAPDFREVFTALALRDVSTWPDIPKPQIPAGLWDIDFSTAPLNDLQRSIVAGAAAVAGVPLPQQPKTQGEAIAFLRGLHALKPLPGQNPRPSSNPCG